MTEDFVDGLSSAKSMALAHNRPAAERESMLLLLQELVQEVGVGGSKDGEGLFRRTQVALASKVPRLRRAAKDSSVDLIQWMRRGGPWRAFLVTVVGLIALVALTGLTVFTIFFLIATANTIVVSFLMSVAAFGALLTTFFTSLAVIYVGAVSIAATAISTITFISILAIIFAAGSVGFLWLCWQGVRRAFGTVSAAVSVVSGSRQPQFVPAEKRRYSLSR